MHAGTNEEDIINFMKNDVINNIQKDKDEELKNIMDIFDNQDENIRKAYNRDNYLKKQKKN